MPPVLRTRRLLLTPYTPGHEDGFVALFEDARVSRWMGDGPARRGGLLVGHAEIKRTDQVDGHEIIYALAPEAWGGGLGTEPAEALVAYGFEALGLTEVHATMGARNEASPRLLGRLGFAHVRDVEEDDGGLTRVLTCRNPARGAARGRQ
ncbi:GNAT family N-acetyltransferase [Streptomyces olindensis]|uniref:GNAT family N-acetyltransferase n=1 Tax=Streptomyces olindensis TaxID=358823 RepID=UPI003666B3AC